MFSRFKKFFHKKPVEVEAFEIQTDVIQPSFSDLCRFYGQITRRDIVQAQVQSIEDSPRGDDDNEAIAVALDVSTLSYMFEQHVIENASRIVERFDSLSELIPMISGTHEYEAILYEQKTLIDLLGSLKQLAVLHKGIASNMSLPDTENHFSIATNHAFIDWIAHKYQASEILSYDLRYLKTSDFSARNLCAQVTYVLKMARELPYQERIDRNFEAVLELTTDRLSHTIDGVFDKLEVDVERYTLDLDDL